jgi:hypothetical protein
VAESGCAGRERARRVQVGCVGRGGGLRGRDEGWCAWGGVGMVGERVGLCGSGRGRRKSAAEPRGDRAAECVQRRRSG